MGSLIVITASSVACGGTVVFEEDGGEGGAGGRGATTAPSSVASVSTAVSSGADGGFDSGVTVVVSSAESTGTSGPGPTASSGGCQITGDGPCSDVCQCDPGCMIDPVQPGDACLRCARGEFEQGSASECTVNAVLGPECQEQVACSDFINCILAGRLPDYCAADNPEGAQQAQRAILRECGDCGTDTTFPRD